MALASYRSILGGVRTISPSAFSDFSVGTHAAKMLATHAAIMGPLVGIVGQGGIVKSVSRIRIQAQMKLIEPTELIAGLAHGVIAQNGAGVPLGYIRRMGRQFKSNHPGLYILPVGQAQMFLWGYITKHRNAHLSHHGPANGGSNVVVARCNIGHQRPQCVKRRLHTLPQFLIHILLQKVHGHMSGALYHHLYVPVPGPLRQGTQDLQLSKLRPVVGIVQGTRSQSVAQRHPYAVGRQYLTNLVEMRKEKVFCLVVGTPIGHNGPATRHNADHPLKSMGNVFAKESRMYGKIIHPLLGLFHQGIAVKRPAQVLHLATHLFQSLIQGYRANGHGRIAQDPLPGFVNVGTGTQIHYGIGPPTDGVNGLFYFLRDVGAEGQAWASPKGPEVSYTVRLPAAPALRSAS